MQKFDFRAKIKIKLKRSCNFIRKYPGLFFIFRALDSVVVETCIFVELALERWTFTRKTTLYTHMCCIFYKIGVEKYNARIRSLFTDFYNLLTRYLLHKIHQFLMFEMNIAWYSCRNWNCKKINKYQVYYTASACDPQILQPQRHRNSLFRDIDTILRHSETTFIGICWAPPNPKNEVFRFCTP